MVHVLAHIFIFTELSTDYDYAISDRIFCDFKGMSMGHLTKIEPGAMFKYFHIYQEAFSARIVGINYINTPSFIDLFLKLLKAVVKPKLFERVSRIFISLYLNFLNYDYFVFQIKILSNIEDLQDYAPKELLPEEYGGTAGKIQELQAKWLEELEIQFPKIEENAKKVSNEKLRLGKSPYNDLFGIDGSFKKINLD